MAFVRITQYRVSCPNCGQSWKRFTNPSRPQIGDRQTQWTCPFCRQSYPGGMKEWVDLSAAEKRRYWLYKVDRVLAWIGVIVVMGILLLIFEHGDIKGVGIICGLLLIPPLIWLAAMLISRWLRVAASEGRTERTN
jgi:hypothetical protein